MKYFVNIPVLLLVAFLFVSCTSIPESRKPAAISSSTPSSSSPIPFSDTRPVALYRGPKAVTVDGSTRVPAKSYLPLQYDAQKSWPLVILLHGFSGTADAEDTYLGLRFRASMRGFIILEPEGTVMPKGTHGPDGKDIGGNQFWNATDSCCDFAKTGVDDVGYVLALIDKMKSEYNIDPTRVYLVGHSNGGFLANRLGCEAPGSFAAIASLAGGTFQNLKDCRVPEPVSYLHIQAVDDKTILYQNGPGYAAGKEAVAQWLKKNGCENSPTKGPKKDFLLLLPGPDTQEQSWNKCSSGKDVAFWTIQASNVKGHHPHIPLFNLNFTDAVLDFLFLHQNSKP